MSPSSTVLAVLGFPGDLASSLDEPLHEFFADLPLTVLHDVDLPSLYAQMGQALAEGSDLVAVAADSTDPQRKDFIPALAQSYPLVLLHEGEPTIQVENSLPLPCTVQEVMQVLGVQVDTDLVIGPAPEEEAAPAPARGLPSLGSTAFDPDEEDEPARKADPFDEGEDEVDDRELVAREIEKARQDEERRRVEAQARAEREAAERAEAERLEAEQEAERARRAAERAEREAAEQAERAERERQREAEREQAQRASSERARREEARARRSAARDAFSETEDPEAEEVFGVQRGRGGFTESHNPFEDENPEVSDSPVFGVSRMRNAGIPIIIVSSGKGGVGKTTLSEQLARMAGELSFQAHAADEAAGIAVKRRRKKKIVLLVDANSGQSDMMKRLGVSERRHSFPTISKMLSGADPKSVVISSKSLSQMRNRNSPTPFAVVAGPTKADPLGARVRPRHYMDLISWAQSKVDLIVLDTQVIEAHYPERDNFYDRLIVPLLLAGAWFVGVTDPDDAGLENLVDRFTKLHKEGVNKGKMLSVVNQMHPDAMESAEKVVPPYLNRVSSFVGLIREDPRIPTANNSGETDLGGSDAMDIALRRILYRVTADSEYDPTALEEAASAGGSGAGRGSGLLSRLMGRKK